MREFVVLALLLQVVLLLVCLVPSATGTTTSSSSTDSTSTSSMATSPKELLEDNDIMHVTGTPAEDEKFEEANVIGSMDEEDEDEEEEDEEEDESSSSSEISQTLRLQGKQAHDEGDFEAAATLFSQAAEALRATIPATTDHDEDDDKEDDDESSAILEEYATCRLHQALCYLKTHNYEQCLETCSELLESSSNNSNNKPNYSSAVRARAYHRRAKARLGLKAPTSLALEDARAAAFLGYSKAVQLYGKLMRQDAAAAGSRSDSSLSSSTNLSDSLLQSLLSKSSTTTMDSESTPGFNPASLLFGGGTNNGNLASSLLDSLTGKNGGSGGSSSLASSVLKSLSKKLNDPTTHTSMASFLQQTTKEQLSQYSAMAGLSIPEQYLDTIQRFCQAVTARKISWTIRVSKFVIYMTKVVQKVVKVLRKYRSLVVCLILLQWTKSAIVRPMPIDRGLKKKPAATQQPLKQAQNSKQTPGGGGTK
jgi:hypothetical protein